MRKGITTGWWIVAIIVVVLYFSGALNSFFATTPTPTTKTCPDGTVVAISATCPTTTPAVTCPSTMQTTVKSAIKNPLAGALSYITANLTFVEATTGDVQSTSDFTTAGATKSFSTGVALTCGKHYKVYTNPALLTAPIRNFTSCSKDLGTLSGDTLYNDMECANASTVQFQQYWNNWSLSEDWHESDLTTELANPMSQGTILTMILRYRVNSSIFGAAQFGSDELGTYICADFPLTSFSKTDVNVDRTDWVETDLPKFCSNNGYDKAWKIPAIKATHGERDVKVTLKSSLGDPSTNVTFYAVEDAYYVGSDGKMKYGTVNDAGTDIGQPNRLSTINIS